MKNKVKNILSIALFAFIFISCQPEGRIFYENQDLSPKVEWLKKDTREFKVNVEDNSMTYKMSIALRYISGFPYDRAMVKVTEKSPSGQENIFEYDLKVRDADGNYVGNPGLDIWDSEHVVETSKKFEETGNYTFTFEHNMPIDPLTHVMEIGLILDKN